MPRALRKTFAPLSFASLSSAAFVAFAALAIGACAKPKGDPNDVGGAKYAALEHTPSTPANEARTRRADHNLKTVFVIVMENHDWSEIETSPSAPYLRALFGEGARSTNYFSPRDIHPSEPNYIWMEAGDNLAIADDDEPAANHRTTKVHLTTQLDTALVSWRSYQEGITGAECPLTSRGLYAPKHNPMVFFDDQTDGLNARSEHCIAHQRPYDELASDLAQGKVAEYNFIIPDQCHDMHNGSGCETGDTVKNGDLWLSRELPKIFDSAAYKEGGVVFLVWDENEGNPSESIGMLALSPFAKKNYANDVAYTHSSLLRSVQDIFAVGPYLRDAANANDLSDLFTSYP